MIGISVQLGLWRRRIRLIQVHSTSNDNQSFRVRLTLARQSTEARPVLSFGDRRWEGGLDGGLDYTGAYFEVDRATALAIAAAHRVTAFEREPLGGALRCTWSFARTRVEVKIENTGDQALTMAYHRALAIELTATRDGVAVEGKGPFMFTGPQWIRTIAPGESFAHDIDPLMWLDLGGPGRVEIQAQFHGQLFRVTDGTYERAELWDFTARGNGSI